MVPGAGHVAYLESSQRSTSASSTISYRPALPLPTIDVTTRWLSGQLGDSKSADRLRPSRLTVYALAMNSEGRDPDLPDPEAVDADAEALQGSQDAIGQGRSAGQEALEDNPPDTPDQTAQRKPEA
jgi:hypothetical protein